MSLAKEVKVVLEDVGKKKHLAVKDMVKGLSGQIPSEMIKRKKFTYMKYYGVDNQKIMDKVKKGLAQLKDVEVGSTVGAHNVKSMTVKVQHDGEGK